MSGSKKNEPRTILDVMRETSSVLTEASIRNAEPSAAQNDEPVEEAEWTEVSDERVAEPASGAEPPAPPALDQLLDDLRRFFRLHVVATGAQADIVALWIAHTYVFDCWRATPYLHFWSPEPGSGKTTALEVIELLAREARLLDDFTGAGLFRYIEAKRPTLLLDEVDGVFGKKNSDGAEDIRKILNSGYRAGKVVIRIGGPHRDRVDEFQVFCPKAMAGLHRLPGSLADRSLPVAMKPPRPDERHRDFYPDEVEDEAAALRARCEAWAEAAQDALRDPRRQPARLGDLTPRQNEICRPLFAIADLAGERWAAAARDAVRALLGGEDDTEASVGVKLLADIRQVFVEERMAAADLVAALNALEESPWGGWNDQTGIRTRELGKRLSPYGIRVKTVRLPDGRRVNGYERDQFQDAWERYLPTTPPKNRDNRDNPHGYAENGGSNNRDTAPSVTVSEEAANPHEQRDVTVVTVLRDTSGDGGLYVPAPDEDINLGTARLDELRQRFTKTEITRPLLGDDGYAQYLVEAERQGYLILRERMQQLGFHRRVVEARAAKP